jgi:PIN domain nuclease of toxin-antitoxin system
VRLLLDTHTFIWWANNDPLLSTSAKLAVGDRANEKFLSAVSTWEMAIKVAVGKLALSASVPIFVASQVSKYQFISLPVAFDHTYQVETMTLHHNDPFDRLLIAQALVENLIIVTCDSKFDSYGVQTLW